MSEFATTYDTREMGYIDSTRQNMPSFPTYLLKNPKYKPRNPTMSQGREIGAWLRSKSLEGGISGGWAQGMKDGGVDLWSKLEGLTRKGVAEIGQGAGCAESEWDLVFDLIRGIGDEFKGQVLANDMQMRIDRTSVCQRKCDTQSCF